MLPFYMFHTNLAFTLPFVPRSLLDGFNSNPPKRWYARRRLHRVFAFHPVVTFVQLIRSLRCSHRLVLTNKRAAQPYRQEVQLLVRLRVTETRETSAEYWCPRLDWTADTRRCWPDG